MAYQDSFKFTRIIFVIVAKPLKTFFQTIAGKFRHSLSEMSKIYFSSVSIRKSEELRNYSKIALSGIIKISIDLKDEFS